MTVLEKKKKKRKCSNQRLSWIFQSCSFYYFLCVNKLISEIEQCRFFGQIHRCQARWPIQDATLFKRERELKSVRILSSLAVVIAFYWKRSYCLSPWFELMLKQKKIYISLSALLNSLRGKRNHLISRLRDWHVKISGSCLNSAFKSAFIFPKSLVFDCTLLSW